MSLPETHRPEPLAADGLARRRHGIRRGLHRSHYAVLAATGLVGLFALGALWLGAEARHRAEAARAALREAEASAIREAKASTRLRQSAARNAQLVRFSRKVGQRTEALQNIAEAAQWQRSRELRDEALSALLLPDVGANLSWREEGGNEYAGVYDAGLEHFIQNCDHGHAIVRRVADGSPQFVAPGFGPGTSFYEFSPDGRLAAIAFPGGSLGVWDWRQSNLVARVQMLGEAEWSEPSFAFTPEGQGLWFFDTNRALTRFDFASGQLARVLTASVPMRMVRPSPSGRLAALAGGSSVEIWELSSRTRRAALTLPGSVSRMAWQPGEQRLALGEDCGLHLWDIGQPAAVNLRPSEVVTVACFSADGDQLFSAGWSLPAEIRNTRDGKVMLQFTKVVPVQLSADQARLAVAEGRVGHGVKQYLPPVGVRSWPAPADLGPGVWSADVDPRERWLLGVCSGGWFIRDAESGQELARTKLQHLLAASFSADGSHILAWSAQGLQRWSLAATAESRGLTVGAPETIWSAAGEAVDLAGFASGRRHASCSQAGRVTVVDLEHPGKTVQFPLQLAGDNSHALSRDGRALVTGRHNQHGLDWYDCQTGKRVRRFAEAGFAGPVFDPQQGRLFTCTSTGYCEWHPADGQLVRTVSWQSPAPYQGFLGFAPDGRLALVKSSPSAFQLYDLQAARDFATLDFRDPQAVFRCHWSHDGRRLFLFGNDGGVTRVELAPLRAELERLGLDWPDEDPSREFPVAAVASLAAKPTPLGPAGLASVWHDPMRLAWWVAVGLVATVGIGHYILRYQRKLFAGYLDTESLAERRADELRDTHAALAHSEKMKALGTMAAGVAHDFNNLLSVIRLASDLIEERTPADETAKGNFEAINQAVQRGRGIVNSMLGYARDDGQPRQFEAAELISEAVALLGKSFLGGLVLEVEVQRDTPRLWARKGRVEQMLFNLIVNAADAMRGQGTLTLRARPLREPGACLLPPAGAPGYVEFIVQDTGPGIPPDVLPRIFEPFFTTKDKGGERGTGLGLSMLYSMAKQDGVGVAVETGVGRGTTFRLLLSDMAAAQPPAPAKPGVRMDSEADFRHGPAAGRESPNQPEGAVQADIPAPSVPSAPGLAARGLSGAVLLAGATRPLELDGEGRQT
jgi:signal transduction histidine kinase/WD40 repeat protein